MVSTGGSNDMTIEERTTGLEAKPDISGRRVGLDELRRRDLHHAAAGRARDRRAGAATPGIALEVEVFDVGHVVSAVRWLEQGILEPPLRINLVFGVPGGIDASPEALDAMLRPLPPETFWTVTCIGRHHQRMLALALLRGAPGIRTGLEDVAYISRGVHAPSNAALVEMAVGLTRHARPRGRDPGADEGAACRLAEPPRDRRRRSPPRRGPETREAIDAAAIELFARLGYHATSMRAIAAAAEVQPAAIYHWYPNKEAILVQLQDDFMEQLTERVLAAMDRQRAAGAEARRRGPRARRLPRPAHERGVRHRQRDPRARPTSRGGP